MPFIFCVWARHLTHAQRFFVSLAVLLMHAAGPVRLQIEYYLSDENLANDKYLRENMNSDNEVSLQVILTFPRISAILAPLRSAIPDVQAFVRDCLAM